MLVLETGQAVSNILVPYATGQIIDGVTQANVLPALWHIESPKQP